jgi:hypothetical protein
MGSDLKASLRLVAVLILDICGRAKILPIVPDNLEPPASDTLDRTAQVAGDPIYSTILARASSCDSFCSGLTPPPLQQQFNSAYSRLRRIQLSPKAGSQ